MRRIIICFFLLVMSAVSLTAYSSKVNSANIVKITQNDEKTILDYLDTKTQDIANSSKGKVYSAFKIIGTEQDKIYIWLVKKEYFKKEGLSYLEDGSVVSLPVVLYAKRNESGISVIGHKFPPDGVDYGKKVTRLFPPYIRKEFPDYDVKDKLIEDTLIRAKKDD